MTRYDQDLLVGWEDDILCPEAGCDGIINSDGVCSDCGEEPICRCDLEPVLPREE